MRVLDAGVVIELVAGDLDSAVLGGEELAVPHLIDSDVISVLRRLVLRRRLTQEQGDAAFTGFSDLVLTRFPADTSARASGPFVTTSRATTQRTSRWPRRSARACC